MDKEGKTVAGMDMLGFGFVEVGTFTAKAQPGNEAPRLWRYPDVRAVRNKMGFNNSGADEAAATLRKLRSTKRGRSIIVGANIGKTKVTPLEDAVADYVYSARAVARWADYLVVNVSSPNTPGLRNLQSVDSLRPILTAVGQVADKAAGRHVPLFVKIAPDLADEDIDAVAELVLELKLDGVVATNTTIAHNLGEGGLSGAPLRPRALAVVRRLREKLGPEPTIIGVGGISSIQDGRDMLAAGANLLQAYSAFIYGGPAWPGRINRALSA
jgi:dihydroorotate oxidase